MIAFVPNGCPKIYLCFSEKKVDLMVFREDRCLRNSLPLMIVAISIPAANFHRLKSYMNIHFSIVSFFSADKLSKM